MKIHDVQQGSPEWFALRMGIPTASCFDLIITPKTEKPSTSQRPYAFKLVAEKLLHESADNLDGIEHIERGRELEPQAVQMFELVKEVETKKVGFITTDDGRVGASPDRLIVGKAAGVEVKVPMAHTHIQYLIDGPGDKYRCQKQGQIMVAEFDYAFFYSFHPALPPCDIRTDRDDQFIRKLRDMLDAFNDMKDDIERQVRSLGFVEVRTKILTPQDVELAESAGLVPDDDRYGVLG